MQFQHMMFHRIHHLATSATLFAVMISTVSSYSDHFYTAAVFEIASPYNFSTPTEIIQANLVTYGKAAEVAKKKGADIIIFPEYGVFLPDNRTVLKDYLEFIPDPKRARTNPCEESELYSDRPILKTLSCLARQYSLVVVANTGHIEPCQEETNCHADGTLHHNTNVAFDSDGTLLGRYHKERLFFEVGMDLPTEQQNPTFITKFGKFGMFTSFDIMFQRITEVAKQGVEAILMPAMWVDIAPFMASVQLWQSWAIGNNVTFIAANLQRPGHIAVGSGIFNNDGPLVYTHNPDGKSKLVVAKVFRSQFMVQPRVYESSVTTITTNAINHHQNDGSHVPKLCSWNLLNETTDILTDYRCLEENMANYTFVKLNKTAGHVKACNSGMCCSLWYSANRMGESYYLGVYNGTYNMFERYFWCQEKCLLVRCDAVGNKSCATFPMRTKTRFHRVFLVANVTSEHVYPSVLGSGIRLVPTSDWQHGVGHSKAYIKYEHDSGRALLVVGLSGRCYDRDPPYIR